MSSLLNFDAWLGETDTLRNWAGDQARPASVGNIIQDAPTNIVIQRDGVADLAAQEVRLATYTAAKELGFLFDTGLLATEGFVLLGYKNHPTETDTDIQTGDRFVWNGSVCYVKKVVEGLTDRVIAYVDEHE